MIQIKIRGNANVQIEYILYVPSDCINTDKLMNLCFIVFCVLFQSTHPLWVWLAKSLEISL